MPTHDVYDKDGLVSSTEIALTPDQVNAGTTRQRVNAAVGGLRTIRDTTGSLTAAQLSNAVRLLATVALHFVRLQLARHEDTD